jgi:hypothetical protein
MKLILNTLAIAAVATSVSHGAATITGTIGTQFKDNGLVANIANGSLVMLISDHEANGFLNLAASGSVVPGTAALSGKTLTTTQVGFTAGGLFGGDRIMAVGTAGNSGSISGFANFDQVVSRNFALVWFATTSASLTLDSANAHFGMMSLADWSIPSDAEGKSYTLSSTDAGAAGGFYSTSTATTAAQLGANGFVTGSGTAGGTSNIVKGATFQIVPEPSAALLGAIGALGLLRRRRN